MKARPKSSVVKEFHLGDMYVQLRFFEDNAGTNKPRWKIVAVAVRRLFYCHRYGQEEAIALYEKIRGMMAEAVITDNKRELAGYLTQISEGINFARSYNR